MACSNEDMKVVKFEIMLKCMQKYLMGDARKGLLNIIIINNNEYENIYLSSVCDTLSHKRKDIWRACDDGEDLGKLKCRVAELTDNPYIPRLYGFIGNCVQICNYQLIDNIVFWNLFILSLDEKIYENEIAKVVDLAYCLGFNEAMMRDWCRAVEYVLAGNRLSEDCDLKCETADAKQYFKHEE